MEDETPGTCLKGRCTQIKIDELKKRLSSFKDKKQEKLSAKFYDKLETELKSKISFYKDYIFKNYPSICHHFHWYNRKIRAYVTESTNKNNIEFRINSYSSEDGDVSISVKKEYYDFYPSYYYNLEEIPQKPTSLISMSVKRDDPRLSYAFNIVDIHRELIHIFLKSASEVQIGELVKLLLRCKDFNFVQDAPGKVSDFTATYGNDTLEGYLHHKRQLTLQDLTRFIEDKKSKTNNTSNIFFVFTIRPDKALTEFLSKRKIPFYILDDLISMQVSVGNSIILHWFIQSELQNLNVKTATQQNDSIGDSLINRIDQCPRGDKGWSDFENIGIEAFHFLFKDNFKPYHYQPQAYNDSQRHRRDLLVHNTSIDPSSFWNRTRHDNHAKVITVEFKNYSEKLDGNTLFNSTKYAK